MTFSALPLTLVSTSIDVAFVAAVLVLVVVVLITSPTGAGST
jgi:hypothetical protein